MVGGGSEFESGDVGSVRLGVYVPTCGNDSLQRFCISVLENVMYFVFKPVDWLGIERREKLIESRGD
jgi:hypothetical protein